MQTAGAAEQEEEPPIRGHKRRRGRTKMTEELRDEIKRLRQKMTRPETAERLGVSLSFVDTAMKLTGAIPKRKNGIEGEEETRNKIWVLRDQGRTEHEIATELEVPDTKVRYILYQVGRPKAAGVAPAPEPAPGKRHRTLVTDALRAEIYQQMDVPGTMLKDVAKNLGVANTTVSRAMKQRKVSAAPKIKATGTVRKTAQ